MGFKRDAAASPDANPGWWGFRWSPHGGMGFKRDAEGAPQDDADFIYLPKGMTPDDLAKMLKDAKYQEDTAAKPEETKA
jgi:hypothetical protein